MGGVKASSCIDRATPLVKGISMQPFVALDFETANGKRASASSVGLAKFDDNG
ncbi:hypothetical protein [Corynebacterium deserti]|uniref:hypothetical protein n=1 Tax=Corynebacterium deserti TaxID=1408191 RepID=UPI001E37DAA6|nr:hypothetical protein [Corynebacterium deserti]